MKMEQSVPKRRHLNSGRRVITQKKAYKLSDVKEPSLTENKQITPGSKFSLFFSINVSK